MASNPSLRILFVLLGSLPCRAVEFSSLPLPQQTPAALQKTAAAAIGEGAWKPWADWLDGQCRAEFSRAAFQPTPEAAGKLLRQAQVSLALAQWRLLTVTGPDNFKKVAENDGAAFLTWLFSTPDALHAYLGSGPLDAEQNGKGLEIWRDIYKADSGSRDGLWLRVAAATALAHTVPVKSLADGKDIDPLKRYQRFRTAHASGLLVQSFDQCATWELRYVVNSWARDEELAWVINAVKPEIRNQEKIGEACGMVPYRDRNSKGVSVQNGPEYYDHRPVTMQLMHEVGGVCGAISKYGTAAAQAIGVPAMPVGQPGHCAFLWKRDPQTWRTGNDISGWAGSSQHGGIHIHWGTRGSYVLLTEMAHRDPAKFLASEQVCWAAPLSGAKAADMLRTAVRIQPLNAGAWQSLTTTMAADKSTPVMAWQETARDLMRSLTNHPLPMVDLLAPVEAKLDLTNPEARTRYVRAVCAAMATGDAAEQHGCADEAAAELLKRHAAAILPGGGRRLDAWLRGESEPGESPFNPSDSQRAAVVGMVESALDAVRDRADLGNALTGRYLGLMSANPASLARAIHFFGGLFEQAKSNPDRKPAIALARQIILLAEKASDLAAAEKYSAECLRLLSAASSPLPAKSR